MAGGVPNLTYTIDTSTNYTGSSVLHNTDGWQQTTHTLSGLTVGVPYRFHVCRDNRGSAPDYGLPNGDSLAKFYGYTVNAITGATVTSQNDVIVPTSTNVTFNISSNISDSGYQKTIAVYVYNTTPLISGGSKYILNGITYTI